MRPSDQMAVKLLAGTLIIFDTSDCDDHDQVFWVGDSVRVYYRVIGSGYVGVPSSVFCAFTQNISSVISV